MRKINLLRTLILSFYFKLKSHLGHTNVGGQQGRSLAYRRPYAEELIVAPSPLRSRDQMLGNSQGYQDLTAFPFFRQIDFWRNLYNKGFILGNVSEVDSAHVDFERSNKFHLFNIKANATKLGGVLKKLYGENLV